MCQALALSESPKQKKKSHCTDNTASDLLVVSNLFCVSSQTDLIVITGHRLLTPSSLQFFFTLRLDIGEELTEDTTFQIEF